LDICVKLRYQHSAVTAADKSVFGSSRCLLFSMDRTEQRNPFCHVTHNSHPPLQRFSHYALQLIINLNDLDLKKRLYLGPTSLDPSLAIIMANMAGVKRGHLAFDPFAGTASILVALAHFGMQFYLVQ
jgi:tRNA G10  N-methylase Trm11